MVVWIGDFAIQEWIPIYSQQEAGVQIKATNPNHQFRDTSKIQIIICLEECQCLGAQRETDLFVLGHCERTYMETNPKAGECEQTPRGSEAKQTAHLLL